MTTAASTTRPLEVSISMPSVSLASKLNWLRAAVLGANDGIVSIAGMVVGVAGAGLSNHAVLVAGIAAVAAGALSMAAGEYVSVSTQRDTEQATLDRIRKKIATNPTHAQQDLTSHISELGVDDELAGKLAAQLSERDAVAAHARFAEALDSDELTNPWHAAFASMAAFIVGAIIPMIAIVAAPRTIAVPVTVVAVAIALAMTGSTSAALGDAPKIPATVRNVVGGMLAMGVTYLIGYLTGTVGI